MKKFTLLMSLMLMAAVVFGQSLMEKRTTDFIGKKGNVEQNRELTIIWEDDFSDPGLWVTDYDESNVNDGPWVIGTDGPAGYYSEGMGALESTTADNGFAMYDSDATGVEVGSQDSKLIYHTSIDCSAYEKVAVTFESYYRRFHGNCYIEVSTDSVTWTQYQVHADVETNSSTANPEVVTVNITEVAGNAATVYFMFRYIGEWDYAWMVDDIKFFVAPDHDLKLADARVNFWPQYIDFGYSGFYGMVPQRQIVSENAYIFFNGVVKNLGTMDATPTVSVSVTDPSATEIFTNSATYDGTITTEAQDTLTMDDTELYISDAVEGIYTWTFEASENGITEENPVDNTIVYETEITENLYSHNSGNVTGGWSTDNYTNGGLDGDIIGVEYQFFVPDTITLGKVYISSMTDVNTSFVFKLMSWDDAADAWVEFISSPIITIDDTTDVGRVHEIGFPDIIAIDPGEDVARVLAAVEYFPNGETFRLGIDGSVPTSGYETWMFFMDEDKWYYYGGDHVAVIDLELSESTGVYQNTFNNFEVYPNPTTGVINIDNVKNATIEVFNTLGKRVAVVENSDFRANVNLGQYAEGTYIVRVTSDQGVGMRKVNLVK
jgi:hypothetical protein